MDKKDKEFLTQILTKMISDAKASYLQAEANYRVALSDEIAKNKEGQGDSTKWFLQKQAISKMIRKYKEILADIEKGDFKIE